MATPITIAAPRPSPWFTPVFVAIDQGFLADEGLSATMTYGGFRGREEGPEADFSVSSVGLARGELRATESRMICGRADGTTHVLMARPGIQDARSIEHVIMMDAESVRSGSPDDGLDKELRIILANNGVDLDDADLTYTRVKGGHPEQYELLKRGIGDGAPLGAPFWIYLSKDGFKNMGRVADFDSGLTVSGFSTSPHKIATDPEQVRAFVRAYVRAIRYCKQNEAGTIETMLKYSQEWGVDNPQIAKEVYDWAAPQWKPEINVGALEQLIERTRRERGGAPTLESLVDLRFLREVLAGVPPNLVRSTPACAHFAS